MSSKRWSTFIRRMRRKRYAAEPHRPDEDEQRCDELARRASAGERKHDGKERERQAVREIGHDVRPACGGDGEEGAVQRERDREREADRGHWTSSVDARAAMLSSIPSKMRLWSGQIAYQ